MKIKTYIKIKILTLIRKLGYELKGVKKQVNHNDFDAIINFLLKDKKKHTYFGNKKAYLFWKYFGFTRNLSGFYGEFVTNNLFYGAVVYFVTNIL